MINKFKSIKRGCNELFETKVLAIMFRTFGFLAPKDF